MAKSSPCKSQSGQIQLWKTPANGSTRQPELKDHSRQPRGGRGNGLGSTTLVTFRTGKGIPQQLRPSRAHPTAGRRFGGCKTGPPQRRRNQLTASRKMELEFGDIKYLPSQAAVRVGGGGGMTSLCSPTRPRLGQALQTSPI